MIDQESPVWLKIVQSVDVNDLYTQVHDIQSQALSASSGAVVSALGFPSETRR